MVSDLLDIVSEDLDLGKHMVDGRILFATWIIIQFPPNVCFKPPKLAKFRLKTSNVLHDSIDLFTERRQVLRDRCPGCFIRVTYGGREGIFNVGVNAFHAGQECVCGVGEACDGRIDVLVAFEQLGDDRGPELDARLN